MSVITAPYLIGSNITSGIAFQCQLEHGPWEYGDRIFGFLRDQFSLGYIYSSLTPYGSSPWDKETTGYPSPPSGSKLFSDANTGVHRYGQYIYALGFDSGLGGYVINRFDMSSRTYGTPGAAIASTSISTSFSNPRAVRRLANGDTIYIGTGGASSQIGFRRYSAAGVWSGLVTIGSVSSKLCACVEDTSNAVLHVCFWETSSHDVKYTKIFSDNTFTAPTVIYNSFAGAGWVVYNEGRGFQKYNEKLFLSISGRIVMESTTLDVSGVNPTWTQHTVIVEPDSPDPDGFSRVVAGNLLIFAGSLYDIVPYLAYDIDDIIILDQWYAIKYNGSGWDTPIIAADWLADPPTGGWEIPTPSDSQYSHDYGVESIDSVGIFGAIFNFFTPGGGCVSYYATFDVVSFLAVTREVSDSIVLTDAAAKSTTDIQGPPNPPGGGGISPYFPPGTIPPRNYPSECIFEFYEMMAPENVETLPVPKRYDQLGPMRFDKIAKCFGFRIRLIMNGNTTSMPYEIYGDDDPTSPHYATKLFSDSFTVFPGIDYVYEIQLPKSVNSDIFRLVIGPTADSFHRYDVHMKIQSSGMQGQSKWIPIR